MTNLKQITKDNNSIVTMTLSGDAWKTIVEKEKKKTFANLEVKGFRKGKVPTNIASQHINDMQVFEQASQNLVRSEYSKVIELLQKEKIVAEPKIEIEKLSGEEVEVKFTSPIFPEVIIKKTSGFKAEYKIAEVSKEQIEQEYEQILNHIKTSKPVSEDRAVIDGDIVNIDFVGKKDGVDFDGGSSKGFDLKIGSGQFIPGFEEKVIGMKKGEEKVIELTFPEDYQSEDLKGQDVTFDVKINSLKEESTPTGKDLEKELTKIGFSSLEDAKSKIKEMKEEQAKQEAGDTFFDQVIEEIISDKETKLDIPEQLIEQEKGQQLQQFEGQLAQQGLDVKTYLKMLGKTKEEFMNETLTEQAEKRVKSGLVYSTLLEDLKIEVTDADVEKQLQEIADKNNAKLEDIKKNVNPQNVSSALQFEKLITLLRK